MEKKPQPFRDDCNVHGEGTLWLDSAIIGGAVCRECLREGLYTPEVMRDVKRRHHHAYYYNREPEKNKVSAELTDKSS